MKEGKMKEGKMKEGKMKEGKMKENVILDKSYAFALRVIGAYRYLTEEAPKREFVLSKQLLRSGTSIGANLEEANGGQSPRDFIAKTQIAYKEAKESHYWIRLLRDSSFINEHQATSLLADCQELIVIMTAILKKAKSNLESNAR